MPYWKTWYVWNKTKGKKATNPEDATWTAFSKFIRLRDCLRTTGRPDVGRCVTCDNLVTNKGNDAGHFISRTSSRTKYDLRNVHLQCNGCNRFAQGKWAEYYEFVEGFYGEGTSGELLALKHKLDIRHDWKEEAALYREAERSLLRAYDSGLLWGSQGEIKKTIANLCKLNTIDVFLFRDDRLPTNPLVVW